MLLQRPAHKLGVAAGMSRAEMDSFPSTILLKRSASEEQSIRLALLESAGNFSPRIEELSGKIPSAAFSILLEAEKLFGPPQRIAMRIKEALATLEHSRFDRSQLQLSYCHLFSAWNVPRPNHP